MESSAEGAGAESSETVTLAGDQDQTGTGGEKGHSRWAGGCFKFVSILFSNFLFDAISLCTFICNVTL